MELTEAALEKLVADMWNAPNVMLKPTHIYVSRACHRYFMIRKYFKDKRIRREQRNARKS